MTNIFCRNKNTSKYGRRLLFKEIENTECTNLIVNKGIYSYKFSIHILLPKNVRY